MSQAVNPVAQLDHLIGSFFSQWDVFSTLIAGLLLLVLIYPLVYGKEPDMHPFLISRQATASPIRQEGESAVYRSTDIPYGYPLRSGLAIKDPGASKWTAGRDGDLRDVWRQAVNGSKKDDGTTTGEVAKIKTVLGTEKIIDHDLKGLTGEINIVGKYLQGAGANKVAVALSNSVEFLCTIFAGSFYDFTPILVPYLDTPQLYTALLSQCNADTLVAEAGTITTESLPSSIKRIIWVTKAGGKHVDWAGEKSNRSLDIVTWSELIDQQKSTASPDIPGYDKDETTQQHGLAMFWPKRGGEYDLIEYSSKNLVSGIAALQSSFPRTMKLGSGDVVLPTLPLTSSYALSFALLALFSTSTLLLNSVAGESVSVLTATKSARQLLKPTIIIASSGSIPQLEKDLVELSASTNPISKISKSFADRDLSSGTMPSSKPSYLPSALSKLKTLYVACPSSLPSSSRPTSATISTVRYLLVARVSLALTTGVVAGAVTQSQVLDYRDKGAVVCVGPLLSSLEGCIVGQEDYLKQNLNDAKGTLAVKGPAVVGGEGKEKVLLKGVMAKVDGDGTLILP